VSAGAIFPDHDIGAYQVASKPANDRGAADHKFMHRHIVPIQVRIPFAATGESSRRVPRIESTIAPVPTFISGRAVSCFSLLGKSLRNAEPDRARLFTP
jgi:hypothetical protein